MIFDKIAGVQIVDGKHNATSGSLRFHDSYITISRKY